MSRPSTTAYPVEDFSVDMFDGDFFLGSAAEHIAQWCWEGHLSDLKHALRHIDTAVLVYERGRMNPPCAKSDAAALVLLRHFVQLNSIGLYETDILSAMILGRWAAAQDLIKRLMLETTR